MLAALVCLSATTLPRGVHELSAVVELVDSKMQVDREELLA